jgi:hypothetical protein
MALSIKPGENFMVRVNLLKKDGTPLDIANDLVSCTVSVVQNNSALVSYEYPNANLRIGEAANQLELEVLQSVSEKFVRGQVLVEVDAVATDAAFDTAGEQRKIAELFVAKVI